MAEGFEGLRAVDAADEPLARSAVAHVEEDAVFDRVPEEGDLDAVALAECKLLKPIACLMEHGPRLTVRPPAH